LIHRNPFTLASASPDHHDPAVAPSLLWDDARGTPPGASYPLLLNCVSM
jgi:hypothetical protein